MFLAALCGWMRSLPYREGVSEAAGRIDEGVFVVVVADLVAGAAVVGWVTQGPG